MNKKLLTAAITVGLMAPGLAAADVKIYGAIQAETGNLDISIGGASEDTTLSGGGAGGAILGGGANGLGVKGTEKLGNGVSAYFDFKSTFSTFRATNSDRGNGWNNRNAFVGVKGDGWHVQFGTMNSVYKTASAKYDPFFLTGLQARANGGISDLHNGFASDAAEIGFKAGGISAGLQVNWTDPRAGNRVTAGSWNGRLKYKAKGFEASLSHMKNEYENHLTGGDEGDMDATKFAGKWSDGNFSVAGAWEQIDTGDNTPAARRPNGGGVGTSAIIGRLNSELNAAGFEELASTARGSEYQSLSLYATYKMTGSTKLLVRYADSELDEAVSQGDQDADGTHWAVGISHALSKRTRIYGGYMDNSFDIKGIDPDIDIDAWAIGMVHKF